ncbi:hypothetical protein K8O68_20710 [Salipaludibacillus sp. CUR1]|uniref:hypothetical protein n=1 Tax=Salipaludibacillus sp. CUR1 TaxID=2820003 RepID=UPI001E3EA0D3|nr:hypothetical protein [Salipaludibacillus sp. CUR1]MCE7794812.1 hypothetical protein [Salipaludibacillus sp. CUR1]
MHKVNPNLKSLMNLPEQTTEELKSRFKKLSKELDFARSAFEFENTSDIKMQMVYIIEELKGRRDETED